MVYAKPRRLTDLKVKILNKLVFFRKGGVDHEQLAARMGLPWLTMKREIAELEEIARTSNLVGWWMAEQSKPCGKRPGSPSPQIKVGLDD